MCTVWTELRQGGQEGARSQTLSMNFSLPILGLCSSHAPNSSLSQTAQCFTVPSLFLPLRLHSPISTQLRFLLQAALADPQLGQDPTSWLPHLRTAQSALSMSGDQCVSLLDWGPWEDSLGFVVQAVFPTLPSMGPGTEKAQHRLRE